MQHLWKIWHVIDILLAAIMFCCVQDGTTHLDYALNYKHRHCAETMNSLENVYFRGDANPRDSRAYNLSMDHHFVDNMELFPIIMARCPKIDIH